VRGLRGLGRAPELADRFQADQERPLGGLARRNRQKVGLVRALVPEPELVILDEATSGLDVRRGPRRTGGRAGDPFRVVSMFAYDGSGLTEGIDPAAFAGLTACGVAPALAGMLLVERRDILA